MSITHTFSVAVARAAGAGRMILLLYFFTLMVASVAALSFHSTLVSAVGDSSVLDTLVRDFDYTIFDEVLHHHGERISSVAVAVVFLFLLHTLFGVFFGGGILATVRSGTGFSMGYFFEQCGRYFFRFLRILLIVLIMGLVVAGIIGGILLELFDVVTADASSDRSLLLWGAALFLIFCSVLLILLLIADYARVDTFVNERLKMRKAFWNATRFVLRNLRKTVGLQIAFLIPVIILVGLYQLVESEVGMTSGPTIIFMFLVQQATVMGKLWTRIATFAGELELFHSLSQPGIVKEPVPTIRPVPPVPTLPLAPRPKSKHVVKKASRVLRRSQRGKRKKGTR